MNGVGDMRHGSGNGRGRGRGCEGVGQRLAGGAGAWGRGVGQLELGAMAMPGVYGLRLRIVYELRGIMIT
eukprot:scaffold27141_cov195-Isochrysis_galbana.AAC.1